LPDLIYDTTSGVLPASILCKSWFKLTRTKVPILLHVHGELKDLQSRGLFSLLFELSLNTIARISYRIADRVLIAGARIYPRVVRLGAKPSKIAIVHVGTKYTQEPRPISQQEAIQLRKTLGLQERDFVIGHVGRPSRAKGVERLLEAFAIVKTRVTDAKLVVVGEGGERTLMQALSHNLKLTEDVKFLGQRDDVMELLRIMDTFVNLSQSEAGISASQIEAMQAGLPSVVTPFSDLIENMKEAIVVQPGDIQAIANAIVRLHDDEPLRIVMGQNAVAKARNLRLLYSWDEYLRKMASLFEEFK
jgi:glycosyltransferase involved in cell wall biosynthesis